MTDLFVIGGGPAGLAAAIAARQRGLSVVVADGAQPPIDKACGEGLMPESLSALKDLGVDVQADAGFPFRGISFLEGNQQISGEFPQGSGLGIRRTALHGWMIRRAEECGVRLLWQTPVLGLSSEGVRLTCNTVPARWIIGADGSASLVRRWSGLESTVRQQQRYAVRRHYLTRPWSPYVEIYWSDHAQAYVTPVGHAEVCVVVIANRVEDADVDAFLAAYPALMNRLSGLEVSSRERGAVTLMQSLASVYRGNVALIGDASGSVDAITGEGLRLAFRQAVALADALQRGNLRHYGQAHRKLARKPMLAGDVLLSLGRNTKLRTRSFEVLACRPRLFASLLALHSGETGLKNLLSAGVQMGWGYLTV